MNAYEQLWDLPMTKKYATEEGQRTVFNWLTAVLWAIIGAVLRVAFRFSVQGREKADAAVQNGGVVFVGNHSSYLDPAFVFVAQPKDTWMRFMGREDMFSNAGGIAGTIISRVGAFPVKRDSADRSAIKRAASMLKRGESLLIFPEGTRRGKGSLDPELHSGAAFIARMGGKAPMIPLTMRNIDKISVNGSKLPHFPKITLIYGDPVYLDDFDFLPKNDRLDACTWYIMRECYAMNKGIQSSEVDMNALFPGGRDFSAELADFAPSVRS